MLLQLSLVALSLSLANALSDGRPHANFMRKPVIPVVPVAQTGPVTSRNGTVLPPYNQTFFFQQLIDHNNPSLGTFTQRYWHTYEFYEEGGPIILFTPGEANAAPYTGYLTNVTINGQIAQQQNGAAVVLEHRFYGLSNPLPDLSVKSLRLHTIQQAIDDLEYFTNNVVLPMPNGAHLKPATTPWILVGGSYSGALTSWTMVDKPGLFAAGYASSAVVEAILDFWQYFEPERLFMPANCSADIEAVIAHIDQVFTGSNQKAIQAIKNSFGMGDMTHLDDVAGSLRNNLWDWQGLSLSDGPGAQFFNFCDALEVKNGVNAPAAGWGLDHALAAWSSYWSTTYLDLLCGGDDAEDCLGSYNTSQAYWTDTSIDNSGRSWFWIVCNEVGFLQESAPPGSPSLVSRLIQPAYDLRQCQQMFAAAFPSPPKIQTAQTNRLFDGWNVTISNLFFANGQRDPWRYSTVSAPGVVLKSTPSQPIAVGEGYHCADLLTREGTANPTVLAVQDHGLASIKSWIAAWKPAKAKRSVEELETRELRTGLAKPLQGWFRAPVFE
ncbi:serine carboxypeptidase S28-domain-containing protein [Mycena metata]|uniref:Serine carboxypeptidase S28-domain-containing protein n=1 Tax=Mycena metata TaxID=1033252 RepID=A0AAD7HNU6_9AGAR|nr:serine carboxypeptidase S28-domain-containing protein [Mycena metata]